MLESSRLWRKTVHTYAENYYPEVAVADMLVDNTAMQIVRTPAQFDTLLTSNMFGDILSDEATQGTGSVGMRAPSSLVDGMRGLYEPLHGSAPDIAGQGVATLIANVFSAAMMLCDSFGLTEERNTIERAIAEVLTEGYHTADIMLERMTRVDCKQMSTLIAERI